MELYVSYVSENILEVSESDTRRCDELHFILDFSEFSDTHEEFHEADHREEEQEDLHERIQDTNTLWDEFESNDLIQSFTVVESIVEIMIQFSAFIRTIIYVLLE